MSQIKVELQAIYGSDREVADAAWTSSLDYTKKKKRKPEDVEKVISFLADHKHSTPFESIILRFWIKMPIAVDRQFMTHRIQSSSGMSGRYRTMPSEYLEIPDDVWDITERVYSELSWSNPSNVQLSPVEEYTNICEHANNAYRNIVEAFKQVEKKGSISNNEFKRVREFYRGMLPQHNMTERVSIMNLRAFANFIKLRNSPHAQPEIQEVAKLMLTAVKSSDSIKLSVNALEKNNWNI